MMEELLREIENLEAKINKKTYGLYNGKMGLCLLYYMLARNCANQALQTKAEDLLNEIADNISEVDSYEFESGLLGIGWGIEWLSQNHFIDIQTHEYLADLDDEIYKLIIYQHASEIGVRNGTLGRALYLFRRIEANNYNNFYRDICNKECLVLLIDELYEKLLGQSDALLSRPVSAFKDNDFNLMSEVFIFLTMILPGRYNFSLLKELIKKILEISTEIRRINHRNQDNSVMNYFFKVCDIFHAQQLAGGVLDFSSIQNDDDIPEYTTHECNTVAGLMQKISNDNLKISWREAWPTVVSSTIKL